MARGPNRLGPILALAVLLLVGSLLVFPMMGVGDADSRDSANENLENVRLVAIDEDSQRLLWPYTSRRKSFDSATLPINVVIKHDPEFVRYLLTETDDNQWNVTEAKSNDTLENDTEGNAEVSGQTATVPGNDTEAGTDGTIPNETIPNDAIANGSISNDTLANKTIPNGTIANQTISNDTIANVSEAEENSSDVESGVVINKTSVEWTDADGSTRYTYVHTSGTDEGQWQDEYYQLHDGTYLGSRYHIRMYEGGSGENTWTAIQVHGEHWDWFRLRHTVDSVDTAQDHLESEFRSSSIRFEIGRNWLANPGPLDSDGWVTMIELSYQDLQQPLVLFGPVLFFGLAFGRLTGGWSARKLHETVRDWLAEEYPQPQYLLLMGALVLVVLGVRVGAVGVESSAPWLSPKAIAAVFYVILVIGTPALAIFFARGLHPGESALAAAIGFGSGIVADYLYLEISVLPVEVVIHRTVLVVAVAVIAAGGASNPNGSIRDDGPFWNDLLVIGAITWIIALLIPLLDLL